MPDLGFFKLSIKVRHHPEDVGFTHDSINGRIRPWSLRRSARRRIDGASHADSIVQKLASADSGPC